jgi:hypothetical protein
VVCSRLGSPAGHPLHPLNLGAYVRRIGERRAQFASHLDWSSDASRDHGAATLCRLYHMPSAGLLPAGRASVDGQRARALSKPRQAARLGKLFSLSEDGVRSDESVTASASVGEPRPPGAGTPERFGCIGAIRSRLPSHIGGSVSHRSLRDGLSVEPLLGLWRRIIAGMTLVGSVDPGADSHSSMRSAVSA